ncbi:RNA polymerase sigma-70 factor [Opitutaceae bacterium EW11]|nr:RNA polymerase sigma-70 factor [Opitutaceae bacterium EW11]
MDSVFSENRSLLFGIAYRMLGRVADAEDVVQETFLRWQRQDPAKIVSPKAWLISAVTRLSIDQLRSARRQREEYVGVWLPEPIVGADTVTPADTAALADSLGMAFMTMLETLSPVERAVFLLREVFDYEFAEIARIVGKTEVNCRKIVGRAKERLGGRDAPSSARASAAEPIVKRFLSACSTGNVSELLAVLTDDVVLYTDGGARVRAARRPIRTADRVSRFFAGIRHRSMLGAEIQFIRVNGEFGVLIRSPSGRTTVTAFAFDGDRIKEIYSVSNPEKLRDLPPPRAKPPAMGTDAGRN